MRSLKGYCDGACKNNPGKGGWGAVIFDDNINWTACGGKKSTTNQEMELFAMFKLLEICPVKTKVDIFSDSRYVLQGIVSGGKGIYIGHPTGWTKNWLTNGWKTSSNKPVEHQQLWKLILEECKRHHSRGTILNFNWIKGHSGDEGNELADTLANLGVQRI